MKPLKIGLLAALFTSFLFANNTAELAQKIAQQVKPHAIDDVTYLASAKAQQNTVIVYNIVNNVDNYLTYTFKHTEALNSVKKYIKNKILHDFCSSKDVIKTLQEGISYKIDYIRADTKQIFLEVNVNKNTCKI